MLAKNEVNKKDVFMTYVIQLLFTQFFFLNIKDKLMLVWPGIRN